jgi:hypothetical protein
MKYHQDTNRVDITTLSSTDSGQYFYFPSGSFGWNWQVDTKNMYFKIILETAGSQLYARYYRKDGDGGSWVSSSDITANGTAVSCGTDLYVRTETGYVERFYISNIKYTAGSGGCGADPYISTISSTFYKMDNFTGFFRLIQGYLYNKLLTINGYCKLDTKDEENNCNDIISNFLYNKNIHIEEKINNKNVDAVIYQTTDLSNQSFIHLIYIKYGDEECILKIHPKIEIVSNKSDFNMKFNNKTNGLSFIPMYTDMHSDDTLEIILNKLIICITTYNNPQIRNGILIKNPALIENPNGIIANTLDKEHSEISSLESCESINNKNIPFKTQNCEFFIDSNQENPIQKNYSIKGYTSGISIDEDVSEITTSL